MVQFQYPFVMTSQDFGGQIDTFLTKMYILHKLSKTYMLHKTSHLTSWGANLWT